MFIIVFILQIAAVANSTEYRLGLTKNANMTGKLLAGVVNLQFKAFEMSPLFQMVVNTLQLPVFKL